MAILARLRPSAVTRQLHTPMAVVTLVLLVTLVVLAIFAPPLFGARAAHIDPTEIDLAASWAHPFGTNALGQDVFARVLVATRLSIELALLATAIGTGLGVILGSLPIVVGRRLGRLIVAAINLTVAFPGLLLALFLAMVAGVGARGAVVAMALGIAPSFARLTHTTASSIANADYISAARLLGVSRPRILVRHVFPNIAEPLVVNATNQVGAVLLGLSALSYIGFGVQPPSFDWGRLLADGLPDIYTNPVAAIGPCIAIVTAGIAFVLGGELLTQLVSAPTRMTARGGGGDPAAASLSSDVTAPAGGEEIGDSDGPGVLRVENLRVSFPSGKERISPVAGVSFTVGTGEIVGVVGESGSGKSLTALAVSSLIRHPGDIDCSDYVLSGVDLRAMPPGEREALLGTSLAMVFQDPMSALNPAIRVGRQLAEVSEVHQGLSRRQAIERAVDRLTAVKVPDAPRRARQYPLEFSGGMRQRAMIGMGLMATPVLIIADEPTTALDVIVQREILSLLREVGEARGAGVLFISHDIAVISEIASRVLVMYGGRIVEDLAVSELREAAHPYTRALVASIPDMSTDRRRPLATIPGRPPDPHAMPPGCAFAPRCPVTDENCRSRRPPLMSPTGDRHRFACWHPQGPAVSPNSDPATGAGMKSRGRV